MYWRPAGKQPPPRSLTDKLAPTPVTNFRIAAFSSFMTPRLKQTRGKRRGHVQQYSTAGGAPDAAQTPPQARVPPPSIPRFLDHTPLAQSHADPAALLSPMAPWAATLTPAQALDSQSALLGPSHAASALADPGHSATGSRTASRLNSILQPSHPQPAPADPWDEEIGDIPWESETPVETQPAEPAVHEDTSVIHRPAHQDSAAESQKWQQREWDNQLAEGDAWGMEDLDLEVNDDQWNLDEPAEPTHDHPEHEPQEHVYPTHNAEDQHSETNHPESPQLDLLAYSQHQAELVDSPQDDYTGDNSVTLPDQLGPYSQQYQAQPFLPENEEELIHDELEPAEAGSAPLHHEYNGYEMEAQGEEEWRGEEHWHGEEDHVNDPEADWVADEGQSRAPEADWVESLDLNNENHDWPQDLQAAESSDTQNWGTHKSGEQELWHEQNDLDDLPWNRRASHEASEKSAHWNRIDEDDDEQFWNNQSDLQAAQQPETTQFGTEPTEIAPSDNEQGEHTHFNGQQNEEGLENFFENGDRDNYPYPAMSPEEHHDAPYGTENHDPQSYMTEHSPSGDYEQEAEEAIEEPSANEPETNFDQSFEQQSKDYDAHREFKFGQGLAHNPAISQEDLLDTELLEQSKTLDPEPAHVEHIANVTEATDGELFGDQTAILIAQSARALELLDLDDDLLLDDDFLEESPEAAEPVAEPVAVENIQASTATNQTSNAHDRYKPATRLTPSIPSSNVASTPGYPGRIMPSSIPTQPIDGTPYGQKTKNDAYDFPMDLVKQPVKPASRPVPPRAPVVIDRQPLDTKTPTQSFAGNSLDKPFDKPNYASQKSFFEELPTTVPKPSNRPTRAAAVAKAPQAIPQPTITSPPNAGTISAVKSPQNPYAKLAPRDNFPKNLQNGPKEQINTASKYQPSGLPNVRSPQPPATSSFPTKAGPLPPQPLLSSMMPPPQANTIPPMGMPHGGMGQLPNVPPQSMNIPPQSMYKPGPPPQAINPQIPLPPQVSGLPIDSAPQHQNPHAATGFRAHDGNLPSARADPKNPRVNISAAKNTDKSNSLSPYIPNAGPYGPSASARAHSRTSSIIGGNAKEGNPYAPANVMQMPHSPGLQHATLNAPVNRKRGKSMGKPQLPTIDQGPIKIENPESLLKRQFPIFNWNRSDKVSVFIPKISNGYEMVPQNIRVGSLWSVTSLVNVYPDFPGPLSKSKTKRKDIEVWLESNIQILKADFRKADELIINEFLLLMVQNADGFGSLSLNQQLAAALTPNVNFDFNQQTTTSLVGHSGPGLSANAYKLDTAGINYIWNLLQAGNREDALQFAISKQDWAIAFVIAKSLGPDRHKKVCSDFARISFPFQTNQNTRVQHLMPLVLKLCVGDVKSVIEDFKNVPSEAEFARAHYREIISTVLVNNFATEFLVEFGHFLQTSGMTCASELCFMAAGLILSRVPVQNGAVFSMVGTFTSTSVYSEIFEYVLMTTPGALAPVPQTGLPDLINMKVKRAQVLADAGHFLISRKYCDHLTSMLKALGKSPFATPQLSSELKSLVIRLTESSSNESGWLGSLSKVNLDKVWGQLDKFIGGEDPAAKTGENGVFSKFSPSISRNTSTLDFTALMNHKPESQFGPVLQTASAPPTEFSSPGQLHKRASMTSMKYAPGNHTANAKSPLMPQQIISKHPQSNLQGAPLSARYLANNGSLSSLTEGYPHPYGADSMGGRRNSQLSSKGGQIPTRQAQSARAQIYATRTGQASTLSLVSQGSVHLASHEKHSQSKETEKGEAAAKHKTAPSIEQADGESRNLRNGSEKKSEIAAQDSGTLDAAVQVPSSIEKGADIPEASSGYESRELPLSPLMEAESIKELDTSKSAERSEETPKVDEVIPLASPPTAHKMVSPKKVNPYAPGNKQTATRSMNRYGPTTANNRYNAVSSTNSPLPTQLQPSQPEIGNAPVHINADEPNFETEDKEAVLPRALQKPAPEQPEPHPAKKAIVPSLVQRSNPYAPPAKNVTANVDISFDESGLEATEEEEPERKPLVLNSDQSPPFGLKNGLENPYQDGKKAASDLRIHGTFEEFPIPGSPEYTTRANSVIGNTGLYSSRLSQSQQLALYQQYEVKDDTVVDYVPVPEEEEDEDPEIRRRKAEARKKEMAAAKERIKEEMGKRGGGQNADSGWFKGWLGNKKNDDRPKPIRAKLGKANTFKYDEKHKRWIDSSRPLEEQLKEAAPPPPPKKKALPERKAGEAPPIGAPAPQRAPQGGPTPGKKPVPDKSAAKAPSATGAAKPNLANAGLDDLLSLTGSNKGGMGGRKTKRRYVSVAEK